MCVCKNYACVCVSYVCLHVCLGMSVCMCLYLCAGVSADVCACVCVSVHVYIWHAKYKMCIFGIHACHKKCKM